jgi:hypothetical protein
MQKDDHFSNGTVSGQTVTMGHRYSNTMSDVLNVLSRSHDCFVQSLFDDVLPPHVFEDAGATSHPSLDRINDALDLQPINVHATISLLEAEMASLRQAGNPARVQWRVAATNLDDEPVWEVVYLSPDQLEKLDQAVEAFQVVITIAKDTMELREKVRFLRNALLGLVKEEYNVQFLLECEPIQAMERAIDWFFYNVMTNYDDTPKPTSLPPMDIDTVEEVRQELVDQLYWIHMNASTLEWVGASDLSLPCNAGEGHAVVGHIMDACGMARPYGNVQRLRFPNPEKLAEMAVDLIHYTGLQHERKRR